MGGGVQEDQVGGGGAQVTGGDRGPAAGFSVGHSFLAVFWVPFYDSVLDLEMFLFLIDQLQQLSLSSVLLPACSSFLHFLYKEMAGGPERWGGCSVREHTAWGSMQCQGRNCHASDLGPVTPFFFLLLPTSSLPILFFTFPTPSV